MLDILEMCVPFDNEKVLTPRSHKLLDKDNPIGVLGHAKKHRNKRDANNV